MKNQHARITTVAIVITFICQQTLAVGEVTPIGVSSQILSVEGPTIRQQKWLSSSPIQRVQLAEAIGETGARKWSASKGWKPLMDGTKATLRQGFDQVYQASDGVIHVVEAKGGTSQLARSYGYQQGSAEWAVKAAERTIKSTKASVAEKEAARAVLRATVTGNIQVHVVRTKHVLGEPTVALLEHTSQSTDDAARLANSVIDDFAAKSVSLADDFATVGDDMSRLATQSSDDVFRNTGHAVDDLVRSTTTAGHTPSTVAKFARNASKVAIPAAVAFDATLRLREGVGIERKYSDGSLTQQEREVAHAENVAGMAGGWGGALVGAKLGAMGGGAAGSCVAPGPGSAIGAGAGAVAGGVTGYIGGEAAAKTAAEWAVTKVHDAGTTVAETAVAAWDGTKQAASVTGEACVSAAEAAWDGTKWVANATGNACGEAWVWTSTKASATLEWVWGS